MSDMEAIYAWTEVDPIVGEGVIAIFAPPFDKVITLQSRRLEIASVHMRPLAEAHRASSGHTVRLVKFTRAEVLETLD